MEKGILKIINYFCLTKYIRKIRMNFKPTPLAYPLRIHFFQCFFVFLVLVFGASNGVAIIMRTVNRRAAMACQVQVAWNRTLHKNLPPGWGHFQLKCLLPAAQRTLNFPRWCPHFLSLCWRWLHAFRWLAFKPEVGGGWSYYFEFLRLMSMAKVNRSTWLITGIQQHN